MEREEYSECENDCLAMQIRFKLDLTKEVEEMRVSVRQKECKRIRLGVSVS